MGDAPKLDLETLRTQARQVAQTMAAERHPALPQFEAEVARAVSNNELSPSGALINAREMDALVVMAKTSKLTARDLERAHTELGVKLTLTPPQQAAAQRAVARLHNTMLKTERLTNERSAKCELVTGNERVRSRLGAGPTDSEAEVVAVCKGPKGNIAEQKAWVWAADRSLSDPTLLAQELPERFGSTLPELGGYHQARSLADFWQRLRPGDGYVLGMTDELAASLSGDPHGSPFSGDHNHGDVANRFSHAVMMEGVRQTVAQLTGYEILGSLAGTLAMVGKEFTDGHFDASDVPLAVPLYRSGSPRTGETRVDATVFMDALFPSLSRSHFDSPSVFFTLKKTF